MPRHEPTDDNAAQPTSPPVRRRVKRVLITLATLYVAVCLLMMALERWLVYFPPATAHWSLSPHSGDEEAWFEFSDGTRLNGVLLRQPGSSRAILYCHGNGEDVPHALSRMDELRRRLDANVFVFDFRGYGGSDGSPQEAGIIEDGLAAQRWLAERLQCKPTDIVVMGRSLGGGIAVAVAAQQGARGLVLQNTFNRLDEVAAGQYPWLPVRWLIRNHYPSNEWIAGYTGPLLQSHGTTDEIVPYESGQALFDACPSADKQFFTIDGGYHNEAEPAEYDALLSEWFDRIYADKPEAAPAAGEERAPITP